ncbi:MAG TPA: aldo/keto reductase [Polyangiaceae bacterium]|nr:aldo/keto reductase [Polyangiaceae bacterium]
MTRAATPLTRNQRPGMQYRRFGRTNLELSVITLGGMRYHDGWSQPADQLSGRMIEQCAEMVRLGLEAGINHIETAKGYGKSEHCYGRVLNQELNVPRDSYYFMTKGAPETGEAVHRELEAQLKALRMDHIDLYAWHGINTPRRYQMALAKGGPVEVLKRYQEQGVIGHVGFSTHGSVRTITDAIATNLFDFVNLHYYYFWQRNWGSVLQAAAHDMGVFIISPNDKGGQLFHAPERLRELTAPLTPIQFNARFCLRTPHVHTLSFGMTEPEHVREMLGALPVNVPLAEQDHEILRRLDSQVDALSSYDGYELDDDPSGINIPEVLRFRRLLKCYDMRTFGRYRYNMFTPNNEWFWGEFATEENLEKVDRSRLPKGIPVIEMLRETHRELFVPKAP